MQRAEFDKLISSLGKRVFILHNVHAKAPILFQTRWAMNFLAGPLTAPDPRLEQAGRREGVFLAPMPASVSQPAAAQVMQPGTPAAALPRVSCGSPSGLRGRHKRHQAARPNGCE